MPHPIESCEATAREAAFCEYSEWKHAHRCTTDHSEGPGGIPMHKCKCGATFYFLEDAMQALIAAVFPPTEAPTG